MRIISATHKKLAALVESGEFRQDLYYRLHVIELAMPSLREMREDIPLIANAILAQALARQRRRKLDAEALAALERYPFPGQRARAREHPRARAVARRRSAADHRRGPAPHAGRRRIRRRRSPRATSGRCRTTSIASSARRSTRRSRRRASTARRRRSCSASRFARCATGWSGWASSRHCKPQPVIVGTDGSTLPIEQCWGTRLGFFQPRTNIMMLGANAYARPSGTNEEDQRCQGDAEQGE